MQRLAYTGLLSAALVLASCFSGGGEAGGAYDSAPGSGRAPGPANPPPIDQRNPALTETATFALG